MTRTASIVVTTALMIAPAGVGAQTPAQAPTPGPPVASTRQIDRTDLRRHIYTMEGALARAVSFGAQSLNREIRSVAPEMVVLSGEPQARGVYLEGYGVFFDVGVPILHQSMVWTLRTMLGQDVRGIAEALKVLKQSAKELDGSRRAASEQAIARLELQIGPMADPADLGLPTRQGTAVSTSSQGQDAQLSAQTIAPGQPSRAPSPDRMILRDPNAVNRAYTESVQRALIEAMLDYGQPMAIAPDEYLTIAARDNMQRDTLAPPDPYEEVVTFLYRLKGSDLAAYRGGQIDRDEVKRRIQIQEF
jgi:hypothetical protein